MLYLIINRINIWFYRGNLLKSALISYFKIGIKPSRLSLNFLFFTRVDPPLVIPYRRGRSTKSLIEVITMD